jgi:hypothetical protein
MNMSDLDHDLWVYLAMLYVIWAMTLKMSEKDCKQFVA